MDALLQALMKDESLAAQGFTAFATPASGIVVQKGTIFHGLWRPTADGLKWTPAAGGQKSALVATPEQALRHTLVALGIVGAG